MKKTLAVISLLLTTGILGASNSFITNFPQGLYIASTAESKLTVPLNQYFHVDPPGNTNLVWVSTDTPFGGFLMELLPGSAPNTVANFLAYVNDGAYENTIIHRSTSLNSDGLAVVQTGGFTLDPYQSTGTYFPAIPTTQPVTNEYSIPNAPGTVAMAKIGGLPNSATDQWFVNVSDNSTILDSNNNGGFTVFARILGGGMSNVISPISALPNYNLSSFNQAFNEIPLQGYTNDPLYFTNFVTINRIATLPYFAFSSDSDACPADIDSSTNLIVTFKHYPTNNPLNGVYITVAATDTNGQSPKYTNYITSNGVIVSTNVYDGADAGFYVIPRVLGNQTITFPSIPEQSLSNNIIKTNNSVVTNYTSFTANPFPFSTANVPVLLKIKSGPIQVSTNSNQTTDIRNGTELKLTGVGKVTLEAYTYGTYTNALVNYYYKPAKSVNITFVVKSLGQVISPFQNLSVFPHTYGDPPFQITLPSSGSGLPVKITVKSGPAKLKGDIITITGAGTVVLTANQSGNATYAAAKEVSTSFNVNKANQSITFPQIQDHKVTDKPFNITLPTTSSKLPIITTITGAKLKGKLITLNGSGTVTITATQNGNSNYNAASKSVSFIVSP